MTAKRDFFWVNSIHNRFDNPEVINNLSRKRGYCICNIMLNKNMTKFNSWYFSEKSIKNKNPSNMHISDIWTCNWSAKQKLPILKTVGDSYNMGTLLSRPPASHFHHFKSRIFLRKTRLKTAWFCLRSSFPKLWNSWFLGHGFRPIYGHTLLVLHNFLLYSESEGRSNKCIVIMCIMSSS